MLMENTFIRSRPMMTRNRRFAGDCIPSSSVKKYRTRGTTARRMSRKENSTQKTASSICIFALRMRPITPVVARMETMISSALKVRVTVQLLSVSGSR